MINAIDLARIAGVSKGAIKHASLAGVFPMLGYDKGHVALFDRDDARLLAWLKAIRGEGARRPGHRAVTTLPRNGTQDDGRVI